MKNTTFFIKVLETITDIWRSILNSLHPHSTFGETGDHLSKMNKWMSVHRAKHGR